MVTTSPRRFYQLMSNITTSRERLSSLYSFQVMNFEYISNGAKQLVTLVKS